MSILSQSQSVAPAPPPPPKVKVKLAITQEGIVRLTSSHPPGLPAQIAQHLPTRRFRDRVENLVNNHGYSLNSCILNTQSVITNEQWANAIAAEIICRLGKAHDAEVELASVSDGGYLAIGNAVYRMTPVEIAPQSKAMRAVRRHTLDKAQMESERLLKQTNEQCASLLATASGNKREAELFLQEAKRTLGQTPPRWAIANPIPIRNKDDVWQVGLTVNITLLAFHYKFETPRPTTNSPHTITLKKWDALPMPNSVPTLIWVPLTTDGQYNQIQICVDENFHPLPHIRHSGACMSLSAAPKTITDRHALANLRQILTTAMQIADCESLYSHPNSWSPLIQAAIPAAIKPHLLSDNFSRLSECVADSTEIIDSNKEEAATWRTTP